MTREEAIYFANCLKNNYTVDLNDMEAFCDMAIKALAQEPTTKNDLGVDCINRDAVKCHIQAYIHEIITESGIDKNAHTNGVLRALLNGVDTIPSVTPQPRKGKWEYDADKDKSGGHCNKCGRSAEVDNYCPNCGSRNEVSEE